MHGIGLCLYLQNCANAQARICAGVCVYVRVHVCLSVCLCLTVTACVCLSVCCANACLMACVNVRAVARVCVNVCVKTFVVLVLFHSVSLWVCACFLCIYTYVQNVNMLLFIFVQMYIWDQHFFTKYEL